MATLGIGESSLNGNNVSSSPSSYGGQMRSKLQALLDDKERQLQKAEALGQRILAQQMELEERINQITELDEHQQAAGQENGDDSEMRSQLDELAQTMHGWATENETLWTGAVTKDGPGDTGDVSTFEAEGQTSVNSPSAAQSSRRAKNAAHRANDVEFAFEIGSGLLTEIRRLQSLLAERDKSLLDMKEEKDDLERSLDSLRSALRTEEGNAEKFREENWNLEVTLQEVRKEFNDTQAALQRAEAEAKRTQKQLTTFRETAESHKTESERLATVLAETKSRHETDVAQMRKQAATLQREKGELQTNVETLKSEITKKTRMIGGRMGGSPMTPNDPKYLTPARHNDFGDEEREEADVFGTVGSTRRRMDSSLVFGDTYDAELDQLSPDTSPIKNATAARSPLALGSLTSAIPNQSAAELETLKQSLAHAHRQLSTVKGSLNRERQLRTEYGRKLEALGAVVAAVEEEAEEDYEDEPGELPRVTPLRAGRGRGGKSRVAPRASANARTSLAVKLALAEKAGQARGKLESGSAHGHEQLPVADFSMGDQEEWVDLDDGAAPRRSEDRDSIAPSEVSTEAGDIIGRRRRSQSAVSVSSSMDGMDPAYANVLKSTGRTSSDLGHRKQKSNDSGYTGARAGNALGGIIPDSRPGSVFDAPGTLASELGGLDDASAVGDEDRLRAELGLGDEDEEEVLEEDEEEDLTPDNHHVGEEEEEDIPAIAPVVVETAEMSIQCDLLLPPPPPPPVPVIERATMSIQTDEVPPPPTPVKEELAIQTDAPPEVPPTPVRQFADGSTITDAVEPPATVGRRVPLEIIGAAAGGAAVATVARKRDSNVPPSAFRDPTIPMSATSRTDTDTDGETDYEDARETVGGTTPTQSLGDYHSVNDFNNTDSGSDTDSAESIKVSTLHVTRPGIGSSKATEATLRDVEDSTKRDTVVPVIAAPAPKVEPKPEVKEVSTQTDDWAPPIPAGTALFAVGPQSQQFQFIPGPTTPGISSVALPAGAAVVGATTALKSTVQPRTSSLIGSASSGSISDSSRPRLPSGTLSPGSPKAVDRTRPPTMMLPPPPRLPPPPLSPASAAAATAKPGPLNMGPPPRPTSPPPTELLQRAATPSLRSSSLNVPAVVGGRTISGGSVRLSTGPTAILNQNRNARVVNGAVAHAGEDPAGVLQDPFDDINGRTPQKSIASGRRSVSSRRQSIASSISSEHAARMVDTPTKMGSLGVAGTSVSAGSGGLMGNMSGTLSRAGPSAENATDPTIIHAITQTMIGEYLYKYTRKPIGKKHAERRHRRYFWIHPYTKTIYWSAADPGSANVTESSAKSAYIESVKSVMDPNPMPPGLHHYSVIVTTANREMKFTAPTKERHDIWFNALNYLLTRPAANGAQPAPRAPLSPTTSINQQRPPTGNSAGNDQASYATRQVEESRHFDQSPRSQRIQGSAVNVDSLSVTPQRAPVRSLSRMSNPYTSIGKRSGTAAAEFMRWNSDAPASPPADEAADFHLHEHDDAYDGLDNVRACCDGKHDVGNLSSKHHHHHHPNQQNGHGQQQSQYKGTVRSTSDAVPERPASPSGWSFRSGRSKGGSQENAGMFSWSRRSRQNSAVRQ
ncbi:hypothetical protein M408DRAFT_252856 [Serendipita vermifera MAFF 305830]|uniref:PH domain-containing protein n=1 Tax=Serendipita vermifera MAFF 305830 TaxID=933852 RepID=A0A0C2X2K0_SERVB|nr:hypothetical protein M408DRAFT_252856 [Serendipita vermifera MAFF 305830]